MHQLLRAHLFCDPPRRMAISVHGTNEGEGFCKQEACGAPYVCATCNKCMPKFLLKGELFPSLCVFVTESLGMERQPWNTWTFLMKMKRLTALDVTFQIGNEVAELLVVFIRERRIQLRVRQCRGIDELLACCPAAAEPRRKQTCNRRVLVFWYNCVRFALSFRQTVDMLRRNHPAVTLAMLV